MANYFNRFPKIYYSFDDFKTSDRIVNIITRFAFEKSLKENTSVYYDYEIRDGDTPEILSSKIYNNPERHWIIMMMNDIQDVNYDWPLEYQYLNRYIDTKYLPSANSNVAGDGIIWSKSNIHSYYKVETVTLPDSTKKIQKFEIDSDTYANTVISLNNQVTLADNNVIVIDYTKETKSYYDYETDVNEEKRKIKLLKSEFVTQLEEELKTTLA